MEGTEITIGDMALGVGNLPGLKLPALYWWDGNKYERLASFKNERSAEGVASFLRASLSATPTPTKGDEG